MPRPPSPDISINIDSYCELLAAMFVAIVIFLDVFVIALLIERSFEMFRSVLGTWLPFALIFLATWLTGMVAGAPS